MEKDKTYKIRINLQGRDLIYTATIVSIDDKFITFKYKFGATLSYNKNVII